MSRVRRVLSSRRRGGIGLWDVEGRARGEDRSRMSSYLGSGANAFGTERARPKTSERSPPAAAHHKIWQRTGRQETRTRTETGRGGRQSSYRATEPGERERKGNGLHARSPSGAHDHFAERPSSHSKPGGGHCLLAIGCSAAGSQNVAGRVLGPCWLAYAIQRITLCPRGSSGGASEAFREPETRAFCLTDDGDLS